jgi:hypothetical protein
MSQLRQLLQFLATMLVVVTLWRPATGMAPPEGPEQQQRVPRAPLTRIPRPVPVAPPSSASKAPPASPAAPVVPPAPVPPLPKANDCAQLLLKGQRADLSSCSEPGQITGSFISTLVRGGFKDAAPMGADGLLIANGTIEGDLDLSSSQVSYRLTFDKVEFTGKVECRECELGGHVNLRDSTFYDSVDFGSAQIHRTLELEFAQFCDSASFAGMTVDGTLFLDGAVFATGVDFTDLNVTGTVPAYNTSFVNDVPPCDPDRFVCNQQTPPCDYVKAGSVKNHPSQRCRCAPPKNKPLVEARFQQANIEGSLVLVNNHMSAMNARQLRTGHDLRMVRDRMEGAVDLSGASVGKDLRLVAPAFFDDHIGLDGMTYGAIMTTEDNGTVNSDQTWGALQPIFARSDFNRDVYKRLEEYFENRGESRLADDVFITMKKRERAMLPHFWQKAWNAIQWAVLDYGRIPGLAFVWSALLVFVGIFVFRESRMVPRDDTPPTRYSSFWYSLDAFLPLTHLDAVDEWAPHPQQRAIWIYFRCHQLLGWILIPLGLASITGIIK